MKDLDVRTRIQLKNVLYTTDFSYAAATAAPYAAQLSKHYGAKLFALHVRPPAVNPMAPPESWASLEEAAKILAEDERRKLLHIFEGFQPEVLIKEGDFWTNLNDVIKTNNIDFIVMGTRGRSGMNKLVLGSVAEEVFRQAECPVLTVGPQAFEPKRGEFTNILFATDFKADSNAAAAYAISLAQEYQARLTMLHVLAKPQACDLVYPSDLEQGSLNLLRGLVPADAELWCAPEYVVERGAAAEKILEVAARKGADLIVMGLHHREGFPGAATHLPMATAHKVVSHANCPVLTIRTAE